MKKGQKIITSTLAVLFLATVFWGESHRIYSARGATVLEEAFFDNFDSAELDIRRWATEQDSDVELKTQYNALRLSLPTTAWGPNIVLQSYSVQDSVNIKFRLSEMSGQGWLGIAFANKSVANFTKGAKHILRIENNGVTMHSATASGLDDATVQVNRVSDATVYNEASVGTCYINLTLNKMNSGKYSLELYAGSDENCLNKIVEYGKEGGLEPDGLTLDGMLSFCGMGLSADITEFLIEQGENRVFETSFSSGELTYPNEASNGKVWAVSSIYGENAVYCGSINRVQLAAGASLICKTVIEENTQTLRTFDLEYELFAGIDGWQVGSFAGVYFCVEEAKSFVGIGKISQSEYALCYYEDGKIRTVLPIATNSIKQNVANEIKLQGYFDGTIMVTINQAEYELTKVSTTGTFAFGIYNRSDAAENSKISLDNVRYITYSYKESEAPSYTNNFKGTKTTLEQELDGPLEIVESYLNRNKYYVGTEVSTDRYYDEAKSDKLSFADCTSYGYFAPKQKYAEWILRFDLQLSDEYKIQETDGSFVLPTTKNGALIGVSFGKEYIGQSATQTDGFFFYNWYNPDILNGKTKYTGVEKYHATHYAVPNATTNIIQPHKDPIEYNLWADKNAVYNIMIVAQNSTVKVYMKRADEDEEKMLTPIAILEGVNTYGYVAITGLKSASFRIRNYSITNISPYLGKEGK